MARPAGLIHLTRHDEEDKLFLRSEEVLACRTGAATRKPALISTSCKYRPQLTLHSYRCARRFVVLSENGRTRLPDTIQAENLFAE
jgi:hypothetical protein